MSETVAAIKVSSSRIWRELRCYCSEIFIGSALKIAPRDYVPSAVEAVVTARVEAEDAKADALRLHRDKMNFFDAALALVHSPTINNVCGWYPEIEAFRKLLGKCGETNLQQKEANG